VELAPDGGFFFAVPFWNFDPGGTFYVYVRPSPAPSPLKSSRGRATVSAYKEPWRREHARAFSVLGWQSGAFILAKPNQHRAKSTHFIVEVRGADLVVSLLNKATYYKPAGRANLILRERTKTDDDALPAEAFQAAVAKARELGWIV
jgi:hypothetical protein